ncbi:MAG: hypothetical protein WCJ31_09220 [Planctomycetia bacterium]
MIYALIQVLILALTTDRRPARRRLSGRGLLMAWGTFPVALLVMITAIAVGLRQASLTAAQPDARPALKPDPQAAAAAFAAFSRDDSPLIRDRLEATDREYRQIEPSLWLLATRHAAAFAPLEAADRIETLARLAEFILRMRDKHAADVVVGEGRSVIGLLDPDRGLDPKEITTIAAAYDAEATVWKQGQGGPTGPDTKQATATGFLAAVQKAASDRQPTTIVVLGHGLPEEIQSYSIPCEQLAAAILGGAKQGDAKQGDAKQGDAKQGAAAAAPASIDLSHLTIICDDCFSADFLENLGAALERGSLRRGGPLVALPTCLAGTNRDRYGIADVGEKFVPHFWKTCVELYFVRRPLPPAITLADFFGPVDWMMYGYGRAPIVAEGKVAGYRLVNPDLVQDPVVFVSLDDDELAELRTILALPADAPLPRLFDIG